MEISRPAVAENLRNDWKGRLKERSTHVILPVLPNFPFVAVTPSFDILNVFSIEVMYIFHLGLSCMLNDGSGELFRCSSLWTNVYKTAQRT